MGSPTIEEMIDATILMLNDPEVLAASSDADKFAEMVGKASKSAKMYSLTISNPTQRARVTQAADSLGKIGDKIGSSLDMRENIVDVTVALAAWKSIDPNKVRSNPKAAAKAYGRMFAAVGRLAEKAPFPISSYGTFLSGMENFFEDIRDKWDPESPNTPRGRMMRKVMAM